MRLQHRSAVGQLRGIHAIACRLFSLAAVAVLAACAALERAAAPPPAIVVSDRAAAYEDVAQALSGRLPEASVYRLDGDANKARTVIAQLRDSRAAPVIAIGTLAASATASLSDRLVVFCQDLNPDQHRTTRALVRGVSAVPPAAKQLQAWKLLDPELQRVTIVSGAEDEFVRQARAAARRLSIELDHVAIGSDRELLYVVKRLGPDVQGVWFAPASRVLSLTALREALAYSLRQGRQSLVFSAQLLSFGAMMSIESDPEDIAERVLAQLRMETPESSTIAPLQRLRAHINLEVAKQFELSVPAAMQEGSYVF